MQMIKLTLLVLSLCWVNLLQAHEKSTTNESPDKAEVYIIEPLDGAEVAETFVVKFGLKGMEVAPAGTQKENSGHHHLMIDSAELPQPGVPMGNNVKHFGGGQTETSLTLAKGKHTLQLILGDHLHRPHKPMVVSKRITITVK